VFKSFKNVIVKMLLVEQETKTELSFG